MTDASYCSDTKSGGWGYSAHGKGRNISGGGMFKRKMDSSGTAEFLAIVNAIVACMKDGLLKKGDALCISSDSMEALQLIRNSAKPKTKQVREGVDKFRFLVKEHELRIHRTSHVMAHGKSRNGAIRKRNNLCHRIAKKNMIALRNRINNDD